MFFIELIHFESQYLHPMSQILTTLGVSEQTAVRASILYKMKLSYVSTHPNSPETIESEHESENDDDFMATFLNGTQSDTHSVSIIPSAVEEELNLYEAHCSSLSPALIKAFQVKSNVSETPRDNSLLYVYFDVLRWWSDHAAKFPNLAKLAKFKFAISASSAESERSFSVAKHICSKTRASISDEILDACVITRTNVDITESIFKTLSHEDLDEAI